MKKILTLVLVLTMTVVACTVAFASGSWHYCNLCGREHSGEKCPEACWNDCAQNRAGNEHKWYDCEEYVASRCLFCGKESTDHNDNSCPEGGTYWNDIDGVFKDAAWYTGAEGERKPVYCSFCGYYGYHFETECLKNPNRTTVVPATATPEPTVEPTAEPTVVATEAPCTHGNTYISTFLSYSTEKTEQYCYFIRYTNDVVCNDCHAILKQYETTDWKEHDIRDGKCVSCGYVAYVVTATATPTPQPTVYSTGKCNHTNIKRYTSSGYTYGVRNDGTCYSSHDVTTKCKDCGEVLNIDAQIIESEHRVEANGVCRNCGLGSLESVSATVAPTQTPDATINFNQNQSNTTTNDNQDQPSAYEHFRDWIYENWAWVVAAIVVIAMFRPRGNKRKSKKHSAKASAEKKTKGGAKAEYKPKHIKKPESDNATSEVIETEFIDEEGCPEAGTSGKEESEEDSDEGTSEDDSKE